MKKHIGKRPLRMLALALCMLIGFTSTGSTVRAASTGTQDVISGGVAIPPAATADGNVATAGAEGGEGATLERETWTVTYIVGIQNDTFYTETVDKDTLAYGPPTDPVGDAHFVGWYLDAEEYPFNLDRRIVTGDITLKAVFSEKYIVTFIDTDDTILDVLEVEAGQPVPKTSKVAKLGVGLDVEYWYEAGTSTPFGFGATIDRNITLYPSTAKQGLLLFYTQGSYVEEQSGPNGFIPRKPEPEEEPTREGYNFKYWATKEGGTEDDTFDFSQPIYSEVWAYAIWDAKEAGYTVNFWNENANIKDDPGDPWETGNLGNYEFVYSAEVKEGVLAGTPITVSAEAAEALYAQNDTAKTLLNRSTFCWSEEKEIAGNGSTVINVYYKRNVYTFLFDVTYNSTKPYTPFEDTWLRTLGDPTHRQTYEISVKLGQDVTNIWPSEVGGLSGKAFTNWDGYYNNGAVAISELMIVEGYTPTNGSKLRTSIEGKIYCPAKWTDAVTAYYELRYYYCENLAGDGYVSGVPFTTLADVNLTDPPFIDKEGTTRWYTFRRTASVNVQSAQPGAISAKTGDRNERGWPGTAINGFLTITAGISGTVKITPSYQVAKLVEPDSEEEKELNAAGYKLADYCDAEGNSRIYNLYYYMPRLSPTLTLHLGAGGALEGDANGFVSDGATFKKKLLYETPVKKEDLPTPYKEGYNFVGWYKDEYFIQPYEGGTMPAQDYILYAKFEGTDCTVAYYDTDGALPLCTKAYAAGEYIQTHAPEEIKELQAIYTVNGQYVEGKGVFQGWGYKVGETNVLMYFNKDGIAINKSYELHAIWNTSGFEVTYMCDEDGAWKEYAKQTVKPGNSNTVAKNNQRLPVPPARVGYNFAGWYLSSGLTGQQFYASTPVTGNITVYAKWEKPRYSYAYYVDGVFYASGTAEHQETVTLMNYVIKGDEEFIGWTMTTEGATISDGKFSMPEKYVRIDGKTKARPHTVTYYVDGELVETVLEVEYNSVVTLPEYTPTDPGFSFSGWGSDDAVLSATNFKMPAKDVRIDGTTKANAYVVRYYVNNQLVLTVSDVAYQSAVTLLAYTPTAGMAFSGWTSTDVAIEGNGFTMPARDVRVDGTTRAILVPTIEPTAEPTASPTPAPTTSPQATATHAPTPTPEPTQPPFTIEDLELPPLTEGVEPVLESTPVREIRVQGNLYVIQDNAVPLAGMGSRNLGDCPN